MNGLIEFIRTMGPTRIAAMGAVAAILVGMFAFIIFRVTAPEMGQLYSNLTIEDSAQIVNNLEQLAIPYELRQEGSTILIPKEQIARTRMRLAEEGLPTGGSVGYEIFDRTDTLGATSFVQNINHLRALEGELARTIRSIDRIVSARVHLVIPERQLFQRDVRPPSASIAVKVRGSLGASEIRAIQHLVAAAVDGLTPERVSIVDDAGRLLATVGDDNPDAMSSGKIQERTFEVEQRLRNQIEEILNSIVGPGRARVRVAADVDFNRITETQERFDPEGQVVRSTQSKEENSTRTNQQGGVTAGNQIPNADAGGAGGDTEGSSLTEEIVNFEVSKAIRTEVIEAGRVKRLSVAVLVDGIYEPNAEGVLQYTPRPQEVLDRISVLVRSAVGFDAARGDVVEVVNLRFATAPETDFETAEQGMFDFTRDDIMRFAELGVLLLISLLLLLFVVRPLLKRIVTPEEKTAQELVIAPDGTLVAQSELPAGELVEEDDGIVIEWLEEAKREGALQASSISKVGAMIEDYPTEAVTIVRGWLDEAA